MVGNRGETKETMEKTLEMAKRISPDTAQFFPIMVYPGTKAYQWAKESNYLTTHDFREWLTEEGLHNCVVSKPDLTKEELVEFCDRARREFYLRPGYMLSKLIQILTHPRETKRILRAARTLFRFIFRGSFSGQGKGCSGK
jgi:radical SAM superfamily enzyme YgiQ (UPF0313 family)